MMESPKAATTRGRGAVSSCSTSTADKVVTALVTSQGSTLRDRVLSSLALGSWPSAQ